jgi:spermidine/putrescine transport system permease protein
LPFEGLSLRWYGELFRNANALTALSNSTLIAAVTTIVATAIGAMAAIVAVRYRFNGREAFRLLAGVPLAFPQLLLGIVLLLWFSVLGRVFDFSNGIVTAIIGHIVYIAPFAMVIVAVQVFNFDATLEDAARDCGAGTFDVYRYITIPLLWPGIFSAAIFAFLLSWGNFYLTYSLAGSTRTLPTFIFSGIAIGSSPLYPAIATVVFIPGILLVILANRLRRA